MEFVLETDDRNKNDHGIKKRQPRIFGGSKVVLPKDVVVRKKYTERKAEIYCQNLTIRRGGNVMGLYSPRKMVLNSKRRKKKRCLQDGLWEETGAE